MGRRDSEGEAARELPHDGSLSAARDIDHGPTGADPHPWYGPCDGFDDGECAECARVGDCDGEAHDG